MLHVQNVAENFLVNLSKSDKGFIYFLEDLFGLAKNISAYFLNGDDKKV